MLNKTWQYRKECLERLDPIITKQAIAFLRGYFIHKDFESILKRVAAINENWWTRYHFQWGMFIRNLLRDNGFGETEFQIENLDDYWVELVESGLGLY